MGYYVYRFLNKNNETIYVGETTDLKQIFANHNHLPKECHEERYKIQ